MFGVLAELHTFEPFFSVDLWRQVSIGIRLDVVCDPVAARAEQQIQVVAVGGMVAVDGALDEVSLRVAAGEQQVWGRFGLEVGAHFGQVRGEDLLRLAGDVDVVGIWDRQSLLRKHWFLRTL